MKADRIVGLVPLVMGAVFAVNGAVKLQRSMELKQVRYRGWGFVMLYAILTIAFGVLLLFNPFSHFAALLIAALATAVCGVGIVWLNFRFSFRKLDWSAAEKKKAALILGIGTAPYLFLFPSIFLYQ